MKRRIDISADEMLRMREDGMSNHDIAAALDISIVTVRRYIGKQGCRMERLEAFSDCQPKRQPEPEIKAEAYNLKPVIETYRAGDASVEVTIDHDKGEIVVSDAVGAEIYLSKEAAIELTRILAWIAQNSRKEHECTTT